VLSECVFVCACVCACAFGGGHAGNGRVCAACDWRGRPDRDRCSPLSERRPDSVRSWSVWPTPWASCRQGREALRCDGHCVGEPLLLPPPPPPPPPPNQRRLLQRACACVLVPATGPRLTEGMAHYRGVVHAPAPFRAALRCRESVAAASAGTKWKLALALIDNEIGLLQTCALTLAHIDPGSVAPVATCFAGSDSEPSP
jgi:hypothetical protein